MNGLILILVVCVLMLAAMIRLIRGRKITLRRAADVAIYAQSVDIAAFRNLMDSAQLEYVRSVLPPKDLRHFLRSRARVALSYVRTLASNAAVLLCLGQISQGVNDPKLAEAGRELSTSALRLRMLCLRVTLLLMIQMAVPEPTFSVERVIGEYERIKARGLEVFSRAGFEGSERAFAAL